MEHRPFSASEKLTHHDSIQQTAFERLVFLVAPSATAFTQYWHLSIRYLYTWRQSYPLLLVE